MQKINVILRCPIIPNINMNVEHFENIADLVNNLSNVIAINLEPYHPLGISKAERLSKEQTYQNETFLDPLLIESFAEKLKEKTNIDVIII